MSNYWHPSVARKAERKLTLEDIAQWVDNDEGLYRWWKSSRQAKRTFIRENRDELTAAIRGVLDAPPSR